MSLTYTYNPPAEGETFVMVTFTQGDIVHERSVNAVITKSEPVPVPPTE